MPVYEYRCSSCGSTYEVYHRRVEIIEDIVCPSCSSTKYKKLISAPSAPMKGSSTSGESCGSDDCCGGGACGMN